MRVSGAMRSSVRLRDVARATVVHRQASADSSSAQHSSTQAGFPQLSRKPAMRLNTGLPGFES
jgi:hypothetical protein